MTHAAVINEILVTFTLPIHSRGVKPCSLAKTTPRVHCIAPATMVLGVMDPNGLDTRTTRRGKPLFTYSVRSFPFERDLILERAAERTGLLATA